MPDIDQALVEKAIAVALSSHAGQVDKLGQPYIWHPLRVADTMRKDGLPLLHQIVAILHDVVEDDPRMGPRSLVKDFGTDVNSAVWAMTKHWVLNDRGDWYAYPEMTNHDYIIRQVRPHPVARIVKWYDSSDNLSRLDGLDDETVSRLSRKYKNNLRSLAYEKEPA